MPRAASAVAAATPLMPAPTTATRPRTGSGVDVDGDLFDAVVLAMPGPQAADVLAPDDPAFAAVDGLRYDPVLTLVAAYEERCWPELDGVFVNESAVLVFVADDGRRRGDDAPVLVAHSGAVVAASHLDDPAAAAPLLLDALEHAVRATAKPAWFDVRRWSLARPRAQAGAPYWFDGAVGVCGDAWGAESRVETAWTSGDALGRVVAAQLAAGR